MFVLISILALTNICVIPYYFTSQFEYFIIECLIPFLNNIYMSKNQQRMIEVKIYTKLETEPIKLDILYYEELNNNKEPVTNNNEEPVTNNNEEIGTDKNEETVSDKETVNEKFDETDYKTDDEMYNETDDEMDDDYYLIF